jgi:long-chain fatty acid transport protein
MKRRSTLTVAAAIAVLVLCSGSASAAGLYVTDRGVRPLARGGAFVAGADDLGAVWYNPAGIAEAGSSLLIDASLLRFSSDYTRRTQVTDSDGATRAVEFPTVQGSAPILPLPTLAASRAFGERQQLVAAVSVLVPQVALMRYPLTVEDGTPSPSRYSLVSLEDSRAVIAGASVAWRPLERFQLGAGLHLLVGSGTATTVLATSPPDRILSAPEDPSYDALTELRARFFTPSASFGAIFHAGARVRVGLSGQLPFFINAPATVKVRLPGAAVFDEARQEGERARLKLTLPAILRAGVEVRPLEGLRVELGYAREFWSAHRSVDIVPEDMLIHDVTGLPSPFRIPPISIPRRFRDSQSFRLGAEQTLEVRGFGLEARAGVSYEESAAPTAYLSLLTLDVSKVTGSVGLGLRLNERWRVDAVLSHVFSGERTVAPSEAAMQRLNPLGGEDFSSESINGGTYRARADVLGVGAQYRF